MSIPLSMVKYTAQLPNIKEQDPEYLPTELSISKRPTPHAEFGQTCISHVKR